MTDPLTLFASPPSKDRLAQVLKYITAILLAMIVFIALMVTFRATGNVHLSEELRRANAKLEEIQTGREQQILATACRNKYYDDMVIGNTRLSVEQWHLFEQLAENSANPALTPEERAANSQKLLQAVAEGDQKATDVDKAVSDYLAYVSLDPPPGVCPHPATNSTEGTTQP